MPRLKFFAALLAGFLLVSSCGRDNGPTHVYRVLFPPSPARNETDTLLWITLMPPNETPGQPCFMDHHVKPVDDALYVMAVHPGVTRRVVFVPYDDPRNAPNQTFTVTRSMLPEPGDWSLFVYLGHPSNRGHAFIHWSMIRGSHWRNFGEHPAVEHECPAIPPGEIGLACEDGAVGCGFIEAKPELFAGIHLPSLP